MDNLKIQAQKAHEKYGDIIYNERPASKKPKMSIENRAAQFAPFAALAGFHESVEETESTYASDHASGGVSNERFIELG